MLIGSLATAKWPYSKTSMNSPRLLSVSLLSACSFTMNDLAVFNFQEQELKAQYLCISTNRNANL